MNYFMPFTRFSAPKFKNEAIVKNVMISEYQYLKVAIIIHTLNIFITRSHTKHINKLITGRFAYVNYKIWNYQYTCL